MNGLKSTVWDVPSLKKILKNGKERVLLNYIPKNLCDFLGKGSNLREYFDVKYYIIDPALVDADRTFINLA